LGTSHRDAGNRSDGSDRCHLVTVKTAPISAWPLWVDSTPIWQTLLLSFEYQKSTSVPPVTLRIRKRLQAICPKSSTEAKIGALQGDARFSFGTWNLRHLLSVASCICTESMPGSTKTETFGAEGSKSGECKLIQNLPASTSAAKLPSKE